MQTHCWYVYIRCLVWKFAADTNIPQWNWKRFVFSVLCRRIWVISTRAAHMQFFISLWNLHFWFVLYLYIITLQNYFHANLGEFRFSEFYGQQSVISAAFALIQFLPYFEICIPLLPYFSIFEDIWKQYKFTIWEWVCRFLPSAPQ